MNQKIEQRYNNPVVNLALDTIRKKKQAIIFVNAKRSAERVAEDIAGKIKEGKNAWERLSLDALQALSRPTKQCERLARCLKKGIAFHHAGLVAKQRELIEENFRKGDIKIIAATPTIAQGVDLPAFRVIMRDLRRYGGLYGMQSIPVLEYHQMTGRAGRPKFDKFGEAISLAETATEKERVKEEYILADPEEIYSKLAVEPVFRTYLLSLIAARFVGNKQEMMDFFSKTFWAHQFEDMKKLEGIMDKMLGLLEEWEFIRMVATAKEFVSADKLQQGSIKATLLGERVAQLYLDPLTACEIIICLRRTESRLVQPFSFLQMISSCLEMRPLLRVKNKELEVVEEKLAETEGMLLKNEPSMYDPEYEEFLHSIKTAMFLDAWIEEKDEEYLLETFDIRPGEIRVKLGLADWLLYCTEELAKLLQFHKMVKEVVKLRYRVKYGAKEELLPLLRLKGIGRVRARKLYNNKIRDMKDVKAVNIATLVYILGKETAVKVKKQVGQDVEKEKVPEGKRKGQISLEDY